MTTTPERFLTVALAQRQIEYLDRLGEELTARGLQVRLVTSSERPPALHVLNPDARALTEDIRAEFASDGWSYVWSWAERICSAEDTHGAADSVVRVLFI